MPTVEQIKRIVIQSRTEGVRESQAALEGLTTSYVGITGVSATTEGKTKDVSLAFNNLQRSLDTTFRAQQNFERQQATLNRAMQQGYVDQQRYDELMGLASNRLNDNTKANTAYAKSAQASSFQTANLAAQFQDIAVQLQGGQNPFQIALQQGTQISQVLGQRGATGVVGLLGGAFASLLSPVSLATIGIIGLGGAAIQYGAKALGTISDLDDKLKAHGDLISSLKDAYGDAGKGVDTAVKESITVIKALIGLNTDNLRKQFDSMASSLSFSLQSSVDWQRNLAMQAGKTDEEFNKSFGSMSSAVDTFAKSVASSKPDVQSLRVSLADIISSDADKGLKDLASSMLDMTAKAGSAQLAIDGTAKALRGFSAESVAAAENREAFAKAMRALSSTVSPNLSDREKIAKNYLDAMSKAASMDERLAASRARNDQLAILAINERKKANEEAGKAAESAVKRFQSALNATFKQNAGVDAQIAAIGLNVDEQAKLQAQYRLTEAATQAFGRVSAETAAQIDKVATAAGQSALALEKAKIASKIDFDRQTAFFSSQDVAIARELAGIYPNIGDAMKSVEAHAVRVNQSLRPVNDNPAPSQPEQEKAA
jgi:hypothetical protein